MSSQSTPFRQFVVKVHSRCDLACDHCYMYEAADQGWRRQPMVMSLETAAAVGRRIADHAQAGGLDLVRVVLHGGEPLLAGADRLRGIIEAVREPLETIIRYSERQRLIPRRFSVDELFNDVTRSLD